MSTLVNLNNDVTVTNGVQTRRRKLSADNFLEKFRQTLRVLSDLPTYSIIVSKSNI